MEPGLAVEPDLIDAYVVALRSRLQWRRDADDIADEAEDHLRARVERRVQHGATQAEAERETLNRFGDVSLVARAFAVTASGGVAVPTRLTRAAGVTGLVAAVAWVASAALGATGGHTDLWVPWSQTAYLAWTSVLGVALATTTITLAGVLARTGRLHSASGIVAIGVGIVVTAAVTLFGWAVTVLAGFLGVATVIALQGSGAADLTNARALRWLMVWPIGGASLVIFDEIFPLGPADDYGDHPLVWLSLFLVCALSSAVALARVGAGLRAERAVDLDGGPPAPLTPVSG